MRLEFGNKFNKQYVAATDRIRAAFDKQAALLLNDFRHPSLDTKLYNKKEGHNPASAERTASI